MDGHFGEGRGQLLRARAGRSIPREYHDPESGQAAQITMPGRKVNELNEIGIFEDRGGIGVQFSQRC
jgi:hypothetical protein